MRHAVLFNVSEVGKWYRPTNDIQQNLVCCWQASQELHKRNLTSVLLANKLSRFKRFFDQLGSREKLGVPWPSVLSIVSRFRYWRTDRLSISRSLFGEKKQRWTKVRNNPGSIQRSVLVVNNTIVARILLVPLRRIPNRWRQWGELQK